MAIALVQGDSVRFLGAERMAEGIRYLDNRGAVFEIGSITKIFTATLLAQQVQKGTLKLDEPVRRLVLFDLKTPQRGGVDVTLKHLASHTSGMRHQPPGIGFHAFIHGHSKDPFWDYDQARYEQFLQEEMKLDFTPGEKYQYSNLGMSLVGYVLSRKTGRSYEALLQENISALWVCSDPQRISPGSKPRCHRRFEGGRGIPQLGHARPRTGRGHQDVCGGFREVRSGAVRARRSDCHDPRAGL